MKINTTAARLIMENGAVPVPSELYQGCGKAWVAIRDGKIVAVRYMGQFTLPSDDDIDQLIRRERPRVRDFKKWRKYFREYAEREAFTQYRSKCRTELKALGNVVSGMMSATMFYPSDVEDRARMANLSECGDSEGVEIS